MTFTGPADGIQSDVLSAVGDYPAVFGWDTLILDGYEGPGDATKAPEQNATAWAAAMANAHELGGINTVSAHMRNFVTDGSHHDVTGRVVSQILPGAPKNAEFTAYLDLIASTAEQTRDDNGDLIPIIFRPFHENTGSWFWWGAEHATHGEFIEIFRYTVEYLRDTKGVSNLLYAYSPSGPFHGKPDGYLKTYPGDDYVDILGYDAYETSNRSENSDAWITDVVEDLAMVSKLATDRGKVSAFTEFGRTVDRALKPSGNKSQTYFTDLADAIEADGFAKQIAYMLTWTNGGTDQFYVPWPAFDGNPAHELYPDFQAFHADPYTLFAGNLPTNVYSRAVEAAPAEPFLHIVSPADGQRVTSSTATVRAKVLGATPDRVYYTVAGLPGNHRMVLQPDGYYTAEQRIDDRYLTNRTVVVSVFAVLDGRPRLAAESRVLLGERPELTAGVVDDFEGYGDDMALNSEYVSFGGNTLALSPDNRSSGRNGLEFAYDFSDHSFAGFGTLLAEDWSDYDALNLWMRPDGSHQSLVLRVVADGVTYEAYPSLAGTEPTVVSLPFADFYPGGGGQGMSASALTRVTDFSLYVYDVARGTGSAGSIFLDDIRAVSRDVG